MLKKVGGGGGAPHTHTHKHTNTQTHIHTHTHKHTHLHRELNYNKFDGDCFALVGAHQHSITIHNQDMMREKESGVISFITYGGGEVVKFLLLSILLGGGGERTMLGGGTSIVLPLPFCIKPDKLIAVDNLNLRIGCPPPPE